MKKSVKVLLFILAAVFTGVFLFSGYKLYSIMHDYKVSEQKYNSLSNQYVTNAPKTTPFAVNSNQPQATETPKELDMNVDFAGLRSQNSDIVGWIYSPGTVINYPIVQAADNDYYLHRHIDGSYAGGGSIFMDYGCASDFSGVNTILYGHHMNDGSMFASLSNYKNPSYYEEHPNMYILTPNQNYRLELFAAYVTSGDADIYMMIHPEASTFQNYLDRAYSYSNFTSNVRATAQDHIVILSTCSYEYDDARYIVLGKLVPIDT